VPELIPACPRKTKNSWSPYGVNPVGGKVEEQWRKRLVNKMSVEPGVDGGTEERRSNGR